MVSAIVHVLNLSMLNFLNPGVSSVRSTTSEDLTAESTNLYLIELSKITFLSLDFSSQTLAVRKFKALKSAITEYLIRSHEYP